MIFNRSAIKKEARALLSVNTLWISIFAAVFLVQLPVSIASGFSGFSNALSAIIGSTASDSDVMTASVAFGSMFGSLISLAASILTIPFTVALGGYMLAILRGKGANKPEITYPYKLGKDNYSKFLGTGILQGIMVFLWSLLFIIPGIVMAYAYLMTPYIICDNPNLSSSQALDISKRMTKGYKGDLFVMHLSFILWGIGIMFTFGLLAIYVGPYMQTVQAMYYENLKYNAIQTGTVSPAELGVVYTPENAQPDNSQYYQSAQSTYTSPVQAPVQPQTSVQPQAPAEPTYTAPSAEYPYTAPAEENNQDTGDENADGNEENI